MNTQNITVTKRKVYEPGKRARTVYDARCGLFDATANTAKEARELVQRDMGYVSQWRSSRMRYGNCELAPASFEAWCFQLRTHIPSRCSSYLFRAPNLKEAFARIAREYIDHEDCRAFFLEANALFGPLECVRNASWFTTQQATDYAHSARQD